jgi:uncharacterized repeat protein (TIGR03803 family)
MDKLGNLYGTTNLNQYGAVSTAFSLAPNSPGIWTYSVLASFIGVGESYATGPYASLVMDAAGNLYGTTYADGIFGYGYGSVFELTPQPGGTWAEIDLYDFTGADGAKPVGSVILDAKGNVYGTASSGGANGYGVVFEITP